MVSTIALGADHAGYGLKEALKGWLINHNYQVLDLGTHSTESVDYPDYARAVAESGGFRTYVLADRITRASCFVCGSAGEAIERAIELNGAAVKANQRAFRLLEAKAVGDV